MRFQCGGKTGENGNVCHQLLTKAESKIKLPAKALASPYPTVKQSSVHTVDNFV